MLLCAATATLLAVAPAAQAGYIVTLEQVGSNVVATGSGAIDLTGLPVIGQGDSLSAIAPVVAVITTGPAFRVQVNLYGLGLVGPTMFGSGFTSFASSGSGDFVGINIPGGLFVPNGYVSGAALSDSMTVNNATFASLGVTPGTYIWSWGTGLPNQNFTLIIGGVGVPDGGTTISLLGCALLGLAALRRKLSC